VPWNAGGWAGIKPSSTLHRRKQSSKGERNAFQPRLVYGCASALLFFKATRRVPLRYQHRRIKLLVRGDNQVGKFRTGRLAFTLRPRLELWCLKARHNGIRVAGVMVTHSAWTRWWTLLVYDALRGQRLSQARSVA